MAENLITIENEGSKLFGILHTPEKTNEQKPVIVIFLHGWTGYRMGPHRMFIKLARDLSSQGWWSFRFDFRGRGYSEGGFQDTTFLTMLSDLNAVITYLDQAMNPARFILIGICSGAKLALLASGLSEKIKQIVALSAISLWEDRKIQNELRRTQSFIKTYIKKSIVSSPGGAEKK